MAGFSRTSDDAFLTLLLAGNERALSILFEEYYEPLTKALSTHLTNPADADEVVHQLFVNIWQKRDTLNITPPVSRYLLRSAMNRTRNLLRDRARSGEVLKSPKDMYALESMRIDVPADSTLSLCDIYHLLDQAKNRMGARVRLTFTLSRTRNLTYPQIAEWMGITVKGVEKNMSAALKILTDVFRTYREVIIFLSMHFYE